MTGDCLPFLHAVSTATPVLTMTHTPHAPATSSHPFLLRATSRSSSGSSAVAARALALSCASCSITSCVSCLA